MAESGDNRSLHIRRYRDSDGDAVWRLHKLSIDAVHADAGDNFFSDLRCIGAVYFDNGGEFLVGCLAQRSRREELIAMGALLPTSQGRAEIRRMRVHPSYQDRGFGAQLLVALEGRARELGFSTLWLETATEQVAARKLYARHSYRETGRGRVGGFQVVRYEKRLLAADTRDTSPLSSDS